MTVILVLAGCGGTARKTLDPEVAAALEETTGNLITQFLAALDEQQSDEISDQGAEYLEYIISNYFGIKADGNGMVNAISSWNSAREDLGDFVSITGMNAAYDNTDKNIIVTLDIVGTRRTAQVEAIYKDDLYKTLTSLSTNIDWTFGEKMEKAGLNTLLGMGTVFIVLIIISLIISLFKFIPKIQAAFSKGGVEDTKAAAVDNAIAQIVEKEEQSDDLELVAVITAAIAAASYGGSSDDFVVRSIVRRSGSTWNR